MSTIAVDVVSVPHLVAHPGTSPSVMIPVVAGTAPDLDGVWGHLAETAEFFGLAVPSVVSLAEALHGFLTAVTPQPPVTAVTITVVAGECRFAISGGPVRVLCEDAVRIDTCAVEAPLAVPDDPYWRRMAARTTSRADHDQLRGWLDDRGFADAVPGRGPFAPFLGALVYERDGEAFGVDNPEPTSVLDQLQECGVITGVRRVEYGPAPSDRVWWLSPEYELHPVSAIGDTAHPTSVHSPTFLRLT